MESEKNPAILPQATLITIGALSSPLIIALVPLFFIRFFTQKTKEAFITFAIACIFTCIQIIAMTSTKTHGTSIPTNIDINLVILKFFGYFTVMKFFASENTVRIFGYFFCAILISSLAFAHKKITWAHFALLYCFAASLLISIMRVPIEIIDPATAGPRYFFYPFIFLAWFIIQNITISTTPYKIILSIFLLSSMLPVFFIGTRHHIHIDWKEELKKCTSAAGEEYKFPIHFTGGVPLWHVALSPTQCQRLLK